MDTLMTSQETISYNIFLESSRKGTTKRMVIKVEKIDVHLKKVHVEELAGVSALENCYVWSQSIVWPSL